jgi:hypothetical protein
LRSTAPGPAGITADALAPGAAPAFALGNSLDLGGQRVDQRSGRPLVAEMHPEPRGRAQGGEAGRRRLPEPFELVPQGGDASGETLLLGRDEERRGNDAGAHARAHAGRGGTVPSSARGSLAPPAAVMLRA